MLNFDVLLRQNERYLDHVAMRVNILNDSINVLENRRCKWNYLVQNNTNIVHSFNGTICGSTWAWTDSVKSHIAFLTHHLPEIYPPLLVHPFFTCLLSKIDHAIKIM
ncbi:hypothetical protein NPIL_591001 [Nephila pilipes]|uniref:Uncharacterized protein n=1 Tax=Nephila pilipes TaxID=299642 RepID=A0A8X6MYC0_NEPPI|nr:hypothetical protein NPIL_591001 [Nephila pilipes]